MPLFGQILATLYQDDIVDEEDIRKWHSLPASRGEGRKSSPETENFKKCWMIGSHMIKQFDDQESDEEDDDVGSEEQTPETVKSSRPGVDSEDEDSEDKASGSLKASQQRASSQSEGESEDE
jgi:translation initiation factor eIF-2B subunit epsilon